MSSIGIYPYHLFIYRKVDNKRVPFGKDDGCFDIHGLIKYLVENWTGTQERQDIRRTWYTEPRPAVRDELHGLIHYGDYGYSSKLIDFETQQHKYSRTVKDVEIIPLYYRLWLPERATQGYFTIQSHEGRSCVSIVQSAISDYIQEHFPDYRIIFAKLMPLDNPALATAPVKGVRMIQRNIHGDVADSIVGANTRSFDAELTFKAKRNGSFGNLKDLISRITEGDSKGGAISIDNFEFREVYATVSINGKRQRVGITNISSNTGTIDISDNVQLLNGHPTFESISEVCTSLVTDLHMEYGE